MLDNDDLPIGRVLSRREILRLAALTGAAAVVGYRPYRAGAAPAMPACVAQPELTVGPYFVDKQLNRSDVRLEPTTNVLRDGSPLALAFAVHQISGSACAPLAGAMVDIWQCDASGAYSGVNDNMVGFNTVGQTFLRGYQVTDAAGVARFTTVYPGWYQGRAVHIHFKIRTPSQAALADKTAETYEFTSQLFFDDALTDQVHSRPPYSAKGQRDLRNERDGIYREAGKVMVLDVARASTGYAATFGVGLDLSNAAVGRPDRSGGPGGRGGRPPRRPPSL